MTPTNRGGPAGRNSQLVRILRVLRDLDVLGGVTLQELAERYGTDGRTIRRDFEALQEAGIGIVDSGERDGKRKRWKAAFRDRTVKDLSALLDASHFLALRMAMGEGKAAHSAASIYATLEDLAQKIERAAGPRMRSRLAAIDACFLSYEKFAYQRSPPEVFWPLVDAISERRLCRVTYRAPRPKPKDTTFNVLPLRLLAHDGAPYVLCQMVRYGAIVTLNLQRLQRLVVLDTKGTPPADFDPARWEAAAFGIFSGGAPTTYRLRFGKWAAPYIRERVWHPGQKLTELPKGCLEVEFTCVESYEVTSWVASWRWHVEVIAPASLKRELRSLGRWMTRTYAGRGRRGGAVKG